MIRHTIKRSTAVSSSLLTKRTTSNIIRLSSNTKPNGIMSSSSCHTNLTQWTYRNLQQFQTPTIRSLTTTSTNTTSTTTAAATATTNKSKTVGDIFLDNLGKIFLTTICLIITALIRSSLATTNQNNTRKYIEKYSILDPFEIHDLRLANEDIVDKNVWDWIVSTLWKKNKNDDNSDNIDDIEDDENMDYRKFISLVMTIMKEIQKNNDKQKEEEQKEFSTIQLSYLLDRIVIALLQKKHQQEQEKKTKQQMILGDNQSEYNDIYVNEINQVDDNGKLDLSLLLVAFSLCLNSTIRDRVEALFDIMVHKQEKQQQQNKKEGNISDTLVNKKYIIEMIGYLQDTCQLVPDAQIITSETKYPVQQYRIGTPLELTNIGVTMKKDDLSDGALEEDVDRSLWTCDDFHQLLRSRAVCAWGECYVKKKGLDDRK